MSCFSLVMWLAFFLWNLWQYQHYRSTRGHRGKESEEGFSTRGTQETHSESSENQAEAPAQSTTWEFPWVGVGAQPHFRAQWGEHPWEVLAPFCHPAPRSAHSHIFPEALICGSLIIGKVSYLFKLCHLYFSKLYLFRATPNISIKILVFFLLIPKRPLFSY